MKNILLLLSFFGNLAFYLRGAGDSSPSFLVTGLAVVAKAFFPAKNHKLLVKSSFVNYSHCLILTKEI
jgi:hypothetical protein